VEDERMNKVIFYLQRRMRFQTVESSSGGVERAECRRLDAVRDQLMSLDVTAMKLCRQSSARVAARCWPLSAHTAEHLAVHK